MKLDLRWVKQVVGDSHEVIDCVADNGIRSKISQACHGTQPILNKVWSLSLTTCYTLQVDRFVTGQSEVRMTTLGF